MAEKEQIKHIIRLVNTDLDGHKPIIMALQKIKGVSFSLANSLINLAEIERTKLAGKLSEQEIKKLSDLLKEPIKNNIPKWLLNRQEDYETGEDKHLLSTNIKFVQDNDRKRLQRIKSYRGLRLAVGLPVRGQRTKSNFRKNKGKPMGVKRKKGK